MVTLPHFARSHILPTPMAKRPQSPPQPFEAALAELEEILSAIESGEIALEESLVKYERGNFLIQHCRGVLGTAEKQIELLSRAPDGSVESTPMAGDAGGETEKI